MMQAMLREFCEKFDFYTGYSKTKKLKRADHMEEELREYKDAVASDDRTGQIDALCDLVYLAIGQSELDGFNFDEHFLAVHRANMTKIRGTKSTRPDSGGYDVIKPEGFVGPERRHLQLIEKNSR